MTWSDYYEKINDWAVSTAVNKISTLEDMGTPDEIVDALIVIGYEDKKGATRLLNRALQQGVKFSGNNLVEIADTCTEEGFKKALYQSADGFTAKDLEDLYGCIDDEYIIDIVKRYQLTVPEYIALEYAEELCPDGKEPIAWSQFYNTYDRWKPEYAIARLKSITNFGTEDEVMEVVQNLFQNDENAAGRFIQRALNAGIRFGEDNLLELTGLCDEDTVKQAVLLSKSLLTEESLEMLYGNVDDDIIMQVAKERKLRLPDELREEEDEPEDWNFDVQAAIEAADYALDCLVSLQKALNDSESVSFVDIMTKGFFSSMWKYSTLSEADVEIGAAQDALEDLNTQLRALKSDKSIKLKGGRLATVIDVWIDNDFLDTITHLQINKAQKRVNKAITQVENIRRKLLKML